MIFTPHTVLWAETIGFLQSFVGLQFPSYWFKVKMDFLWQVYGPRTAQSHKEFQYWYKLYAIIFTEIFFINLYVIFL